MATAIRTPLFSSTSSPTSTSFPSSRNQPLFCRLHSSKRLRPFSYFSVTCSSSQSQPEPPLHRPPYVRILDTTIRNGEQSPKEKLDIARQLSKFGVDTIETGFPAASKHDFEAVKMIANEFGNAVYGDVPVICALSRCNESDIGTAWEAVKHAKRPRIDIFIATRANHMEYELGMSREQVIEKARSMVAFARSLGCQDVEFSPEDAGRLDREFLYQILVQVINAGATTLNISDTVGITTPTEFVKLIADIKANTPGVDNLIISTHFQNDLRLSTANTIEGARARGRQLVVTINGIGASLEEAGNIGEMSNNGELFKDLGDIGYKKLVLLASLTALKFTTVGQKLFAKHYMPLVLAAVNVYFLLWIFYTLVFVHRTTITTLFPISLLYGILCAVSFAAFRIISPDTNFAIFNLASWIFVFIVFIAFVYYKNPTFDDAATYGSELALVQLTVNGEGISQPRMTGFDRDYDGMVDLENRAL